ncbi:DUF4142 domain-containing protein [Streptomyces yaanensis]|uniref:DUF4142 domain-containing protein n=1 Tax=Streptomyces yaanensis TaxID=1142239 RepID=A0ABV7SAR7_9ACTN|nr:DUF4142 domain-containing protein [Streptomyces sp. CGMCC 4.7035]WNB96677.1 DUF4142 domain-containing protein [Streptomyces sp. CGMCC 4.7035]
MRISRNVAGTVFVAGALTLTLTALAYPSMLGVQTTSSDTSRVIANTSAGPLTEADRQFVVKVRAAGLWEFPSGELAMKKGTTDAVRTAGQHLINGHVNLDDTCRKVAAQLGIALPNQPSPQQQGFVATLTSDSGKQFDQDLANILRVTHGQIFPAIANIRATTRNTLVRQLADQANDTVLDHITVLERTGLVNFDSVLFQETTPPKDPKSNLTPPSPQPGEPTVVLSPPAGFTPPPSAPTGPSPAPTAG